MEMGQQVEKQNLRSKARVIIDRVENKTSRSSKISDLIINKIKESKPSNVLLYYPVRDEVDIKSVFDFCWNNEIVTFSTFIDDIQIGKVNSFGDFVEYRNYQQPKISLDEKLKIDLAVVPGLFFTKIGDRLGQGRGWYDRFFGVNEVDYKIGICFSEQLVEELPVDISDIKMHEVIFG